MNGSRWDSGDAAHAKISEEKVCMRARSENNVSCIGVRTSQGRFVTVGNKEFWWGSTQMTWNVGLCWSVFGERDGFRFRQCFLRNRHCAGVI